jgi:ABC-type polysaccharide/polyol phosphate export permease
MYKRIGPVTSIVRTSFLFLTGALVPLDVLPKALKTLALFLPMTDGVALIQRLLVNNTPLQDVFLSVGMLRCLANALIYFTVGVFAFWHFERKARKEGLLAVY